MRICIFLLWTAMLLPTAESRANIAVQFLEKMKGIVSKISGSSVVQKVTPVFQSIANTKAAQTISQIAGVAFSVTLANVVIPGVRQKFGDMTLQLNNLKAKLEMQVSSIDQEVATIDQQAAAGIAVDAAGQTVPTATTPDAAKGFTVSDPNAAARKAFLLDQRQRYVAAMAPLEQLNSMLSQILNAAAVGRIDFDGLISFAQNAPILLQQAQQNLIGTAENADALVTSFNLVDEYLAGVLQQAGQNVISSTTTGATVQSSSTGTIGTLPSGTATTPATGTIGTLPSGTTTTPAMGTAIY